MELLTPKTMTTQTLAKAVLENRHAEFGLEVEDGTVVGVVGLSGEEEWLIVDKVNEALRCDICGGVGEYEELEYECNDSTGYNTIIHGTGRFKACPNCN